MSHKKTSQKENPTPRRRKRRWLRRLFFTSLILTLLIGIAQGPVLRIVVENALTKALDSTQLKGTFSVEGSLFSGLELRSVNLTGKGAIRKLQADRLAVNYRLTELIHGRINSIHGDGLQVWVDIGSHDTSKQTTSTTTTTESNQATNTPVNLEKIRQMVLPIELQMDHSSVWISREDRCLWQARDISISHHIGSEDFHLTLGQFMDMDETVSSKQEIRLTWAHNQATIQGFPIRSDTTLTQLTCTWEPTKDPIIPQHIQAKINWDGGDFTIDLDSMKKAQITLDRGEITLEQFAPLIGREGELGGKITTLVVSVDDIMAPPATMHASAEINGQNLRWQDRSVKNLHLDTQMASSQLKLKVKLHLDQEEATTLEARAQLPDSASPDWPECWHHASASLLLHIPALDKLALPAAQLANIQPIPGGWPKGAIQLSAKTTLAGKTLGKINTTLQWTTPAWAGLTWNQIKLLSTWDPDSNHINADLHIAAQENETITAKAGYHLNTQQYQAELTVQSLNLKKLRPALDLFKQSTPRAGILDLTWKGEGHGADTLTYQGDIKTTVTGLDVEPKEGVAPSPTMDITLRANYAKDLEVSLDHLELKRDNLHAIAAGRWKNQQIHISNLELRDNEKPLVRGQAKLPFSRNLSDLNSFLKQAGKIDADFHIKDLAISDIYQLLPQPTQPAVTGKITLDLTLRGTLQNPAIDFSTNAERIQIPNNSKVPPTNVTLKLHTKDDEISLDGTINPNGYQALSLVGKMPYHPKRWIDDSETIKKENINVVLDTQSITLEPFSKFLPHISKIDGTLTAKINATGPMGAPNITGNARLLAPRVDSMKKSIPDLRDMDIKLNFTDNQLTIEPSSCLVAGGQYQLQGKVALSDITNPIFDISLIANKALLWRDDSMIVRADAQLSLNGPYKKAQIQGDIGIVESMFYKDIQIIPLGGKSTSSQPGKAQLPSFTTAKTSVKKTSSLPAPFDQWTLDLRIKTKEDFLIRGNVAQGNAQGAITITGTLADPKPDGTVSIEQLEAVLPFSRLYVKKGTIVFTPKTGFDPQLSIKATSRVGSHDVEATVYGRASSPQHLLNSSPPLPKNEIFFLLATGSTADNLTESGAATGKASQLLLDTWLRSSPHKFKKLKEIIGQLNQKIDINIGATDPFTGREFNSATVKIHNRWYFIASIDLESNSRGVILYAIRFK